MFLNREEAGIRLALRLSQEKKFNNPLLVAIPRGGVVIGKVISDILGIPFTIMIVKKIGAPDNSELAVGAFGSGGVYWDEDLISNLKIGEPERKNLLERTKKLIEEREKKFGTTLPEVKNRDVIIIDDGVATGSTVIAAGKILKEKGVGRVILATPVISKRTKKELEIYFDKIIAVIVPMLFSSVGAFYKEFPQIEDDEVVELLSGK